MKTLAMIIVVLTLTSCSKTEKAFDKFCHSKYGVVGEVAGDDYPQVDMHMKGQS